MRPFWLAALFAARVVLPLDARAASPDVPAAEALFQSGKEALTQGNLPVACARFAESVRLDPAVGSLLNLADCETRLGKLASALAHFQEARDRLPPQGDYRTVYVVDRVADLSARVPRLTLRVRGLDPSLATVLRDETTLGAATLGVALPVDPGVHTLTLRVAGHADAQRQVTLGEGDSLSIELVAGPEIAVESSTSAAADARPEGRTQHAVALVLGGAGLVSIATGALVGVIAKSTYDDARTHCPAGPASCSSDGVTGGRRAYDEATAATVALIGGGVFVAGGFVLYITAPHEAHPASVAPAIGKDAAGLNLVGTW